MNYSILENLLVEGMYEKHSCPICRSLLWGPVAQCKNGHYCCKEDWIKITNDKKCCSQCRVNIISFESLSRNIYIEEEIRNLVIHCPNSIKNPERKLNDQGCDITFTIDTLEGHLKSCLFQLCECKNSKECGMIKRSDLENHYSMCPYSVIVCECGKEMIKKLKNDHQEKDCSVIIVQCSDCSNSFQRCELESHTQVCQERATDCPYSNYSCDAKPKRKDIQQHLDQVDHLILVKNKADSLIEQVGNLTLQTQLLKQQLLDLNSKKKFSSKWNIRNWSDKVKKYPQGQSFNSSVFNVSSNKKFFIKVFPNGQDTNKLSVALCKNFDTKCKINFSFEIQNVDITKSIVQEETFLFAKGTTDYYVITFYEDLNADDGFIINNTLIIGFNINIEKVYSEHLISN